MIGLRRFGFVLAALFGIAIFGCLARADEYPSRPITMVVPFPAGGLSDIAARAISQELQLRTGQSVVVENRVGGSGSVGASYVKRAAPDGYTLLVNAAADVTSPPYMNLPYDHLVDFTPIGMIAEGPSMVLSVSSAAPYKTVSDLIAYGRMHPGTLSFGSSGPGTQPSIAITQLKALTGIDVTDVPYRGVALAALGILSGEVQASFVYQSSARALVDEGKVRALAVTDATRDPAWPQIPTMIETGYPNFVHVAFVGLTSPPNTPPDIIAILSRHLNAIVKEDSFRARFKPYGMVTREKNTPADFAAYLRTETTKYREIAKLQK